MSLHDTAAPASTLERFAPHLRLKLPFLVAGFASFVFSVLLYFVFDEKMAGIFVGLWVPSIHSLGSLLLVDRPQPTQVTDGRREEVLS